MAPIHLLGFFGSVGLYFMMVHGNNKWNDDPEESIRSALYKCVPISCLAALASSIKSVDSDHLYLKRNIVAGLIFSVGGDFALVWKEKFFIPGLLFFAIAHVFYTRGFRFQPFGYEAAFVSYSACFVMYMIFLPTIPETELKILAGLYMVLIFTMWWRTIVRWQMSPSLGNLCGCLGALVFLVSDFVLGYQKWVHEIPFGCVVNMITYYTGQFGITLAVVFYRSGMEDDRQKKKG